jgi:hypothetical protein
VPQAECPLVPKNAFLHILWGYSTIFVSLRRLLFTRKLMVPNVVFQSVEYAGREHAYVILAVLREVHWGGIDHKIVHSPTHMSSLLVVD